VPIHFVCPHCAAVTEIAEKYAGQTGPCAHCGKAITIPIPGGNTPDRSRSTAATVLAVVAAVLGVAILGIAVLAVLWWQPGESTSSGVARRMQCVNNLKQIALAMQAYEAANGCFPPAYVADKQGKPMHSWRVLLLPYLEEQNLADQYNLNEPWNSPRNRKVTDVTIDLFQCPGQPTTAEPTTNYMMVVGPRTISSGREPRKIAEIIDGLADTILLVEVADSSVRWAEPQDLHFDRLNFAVNGNRRQASKGISSYHPGGVNVVFCDSSVRFLKDSTNPQLVKAMLTVDGGETVPAAEP
jgi:prepilin-type processing-associated H-X9-DG protein